ncbi:acyl-homoserine-lactone synthase [Novosphingobium sp.]|uniref:acyl-homoserine-lactone synthase n=1 Tax=Novosphingobium sp. TaxID=1874826 RepID=UPI0031D892EC
MLLDEKPKEHSVSDEAMRTMFAARKAVFVDLLKWDVPVLAGQYEVDQFDNSHANYIILAEPDGNHLGSARLLPTTRPHILDSFYADLCDEAPPRDPDIVEITRFCLDRRLCAAQRRQVRDALVTALVTYALQNGISAYTAIASLPWFSQIMTFGWDCRALGMPRGVDGKPTVALRIEITLETPELLKDAGIFAVSLPNNGFIMA